MLGRLWNLEVLSPISIFYPYLYYTPPPPPIPYGGGHLGADYWKSDGDREAGGSICKNLFWLTAYPLFLFAFPPPPPPLPSSPIIFVMVRLLTGVCGVAVLLRYFAVFSWIKFHITVLRWYHTLQCSFCVLVNLSDLLSRDNGGSISCLQALVTEGKFPLLALGFVISE